MNKPDILQCASLTASYTNYEDFQVEERIEQKKTWTFTAEDLKNFVAALKMVEK